MLEVLSQIEIKLNWLPMIPFLVYTVYMRGTHLTFGKPFVRKQYNVLVFLIASAKSMKVPIELSEDCCRSLSVPIANRQTAWPKDVVTWPTLKIGLCKICYPCKICYLPEKLFWAKWIFAQNFTVGIFKILKKVAPRSILRISAIMKMVEN